MRIAFGKTLGLDAVFAKLPMSFLSTGKSILLCPTILRQRWRFYRAKAKTKTIRRGLERTSNIKVKLKAEATEQHKNNHQYILHVFTVDSRRVPKTGLKTSKLQILPCKIKTLSQFGPVHPRITNRKSQNFKRLGFAMGAAFVQRGLSKKAHIETINTLINNIGLYFNILRQPCQHTALENYSHPLLCPPIRCNSLSGDK